MVFLCLVTYEVLLPGTYRGNNNISYCYFHYKIQGFYSKLKEAMIQQMTINLYISCSIQYLIRKQKPL